MNGDELVLIRYAEIFLKGGNKTVRAKVGNTKVKLHTEVLGRHGMCDPCPV